MKFSSLLGFLEKKIESVEKNIDFRTKIILEWPPNLTRPLLTEYPNTENGVTDPRDSFATLILTFPPRVLEISA